jgi:hypothetical protein
MHKEESNAYRIFMGKQEGSRSIGIRRCKLKDNIKVDLREKLWGGLVWIHLSKDMDHWRVLINTVMNLQVP